MWHRCCEEGYPEHLNAFSNTVVDASFFLPKGIFGASITLDNGCPDAACWDLQVVLVTYVTRLHYSASKRQVVPMTTDLSSP